VSDSRNAVFVCQSGRIEHAEFSWPCSRPACGGFETAASFIGVQHAASSGSRGSFQILDGAVSPDSVACSTVSASPQLDGRVRCLTGLCCLILFVLPGTAGIRSSPAWPWCLQGVLHAVEPTLIANTRLRSPNCLSVTHSEPGVSVWWFGGRLGG
jgi:hypothetical protein